MRETGHIGPNSCVPCTLITQLSWAMSRSGSDTRADLSPVNVTNGHVLIDDKAGVEKSIGSRRFAGNGCEKQIIFTQIKARIANLLRMDCLSKGIQKYICI